jgi:hypothetical protein
VIVLVARSGVAGPPTGAAALVPADTLAYVHVSIDPRRPAVRRARRLAALFPDYPTLANAVTARLGAILGGGVPLDYTRQIRPWLGPEAAFAVLNTPGASAGSLIVLSVKRRGPLFDTSALPSGRYHGVRLYREQSGSELAFIGRYLVVGQDASVRAAIDVAQRRARSLADSATYQAASAGEPAARVLDAYASAAGLQRLLAPRGGIAGALALLLSQPGFRGATLAVAPVSGGATIRIHSALTSNAARAGPAVFAPALAGRTPDATRLLLDVGDLARAGPTILAAAAQLGLLSRLGPLLGRLGAALSAEGIDVPRIISLLRAESAVMISESAGVPALTVVARTGSPNQARTTLAALEAPLAQIFTPPGSSAGQVPEWSDQPVGGVIARQFAFSPGLQLSYAVFDGLIVVSTSTTAIGEIARAGRSLADDRVFRRAGSERPDRVTSLLFLDFSQLLSLGEQTGLVRSSLLRRLGPDVDRIRAIGASSTSGEADTTAELFLEIS